MSDFLKSLRTSKQKNSTTRKSMGSYHSSNAERRHLKNRRNANFNNLPQNEELTKILHENISTIAVNIEKAVDIQELLGESEIEKNNATTTLIKNISDFLTGNNLPHGIQGQPRGEPVVTTSYASGTRYTKDEVLDIIKTMRKDRATFATIAAYLKEKRIPTFSGRGDWHAQTIHRLCK